jgi:hypothetical protein
MSVERIIDALCLPREARLNQRVPKKLFSEQAAATAADRRQIQEGIEELAWVGTLKPNTIGVAAFRNDEREYLEIAVMTLDVRVGAKVARIIELIHRAIPYPVLLVTRAADGITISVAPKRQAQNEAGRVVVERIITTAPFDLDALDFSADLLTSLNLAAQPSRDLYAVYEGWAAVVEASEAACVTGQFVVPRSADAIQSRREALAEHLRLDREILAVRARAVKEKQIARRAELNLELRRLTSALNEASSRL